MINTESNVIQPGDDIPVSFFIDNIYSVDQLIHTIDSLKSQTYSLNKVDLILLDYSTHNIKSIADVYSGIFCSINVIKVSHINREKKIEESLSQYNDLIVFIDSGNCLRESFLKYLANIKDYSETTIFSLPVHYRVYYKNQIFFQLMYSFIDRLNGSLQNRHFIFSSRNIILHKNNLMTLLNNSIENIVHSRLNDVNMYLQNSCREYFDLKIRLKAAHMAVVLVNIFFLVEIINFLASPTMNTLFALSIKIITDIFVIYTDYNNMKIKFPKIEFLIFSIVYPFYFVKNFVVTRLIYRG